MRGFPTRRRGGGEEGGEGPCLVIGSMVSPALLLTVYIWCHVFHMQPCWPTSAVCVFLIYRESGFLLTAGKNMSVLITLMNVLLVRSRGNSGNSGCEYCSLCTVGR